VTERERDRRSLDTDGRTQCTSGMPAVARHIWYAAVCEMSQMSNRSLATRTGTGEACFTHLQVRQPVRTRDEHLLRCPWFDFRGIVRTRYFRLELPGREQIVHMSERSLEV
jgi:hypothetical protein